MTNVKTIIRQALLSSALIIGASTIATASTLSTSVSAAAQPDRIGTTIYCSGVSPVIKVVRTRVDAYVVSSAKSNNIKYSYMHNGNTLVKAEVKIGETNKYPALSTTKFDDFHYIKNQVKKPVTPCGYDSATERGEIVDAQGNVLARVALYDKGPQYDGAVNSTLVNIRSTVDRPLVGTIGVRNCQCGGGFELDAGALESIHMPRPVGSISLSDSWESPEYFYYESLY